MTSPDGKYSSNIVRLKSLASCPRDQVNLCEVDGKLVVIKKIFIMIDDSRNDYFLFGKLIRELILRKQQKYENIVKIYDIHNDHKDRICEYRMEYCENLQEFIEKRGELKLKPFLELWKNMMEGF